MKSRQAPWLCGLTLLCGFALPRAAFSSECELLFDEDGVTVEACDVGGSDYQGFRARAVIAAAPEQVLQRIQDVEHYPDWFPDTVEARRLELTGHRWANYVRTGAPWPVKDRDAIYTQDLQRRDDTIVISIGVAPDELPEAKGAVRVRAAKGLWELVPVDAGTALRWEFHLEPGGKIPSGLVNAQIMETPRQALQALKAFFVATAKETP
ncbi:MAG: SRPBCC family protein [Congregibacter sp.]|nr:SRPBCC family protein [Congregibacter sp.]